MNSLTSKLQMAFLNPKKPKNLMQKGFTLVELMIVIVVVGVLSSVALPQFLGVKDKAAANSEVGEFIGLAKECSAAILIDGPYPEDYPTGTANSDCHLATDDTKAPNAPVIFTGTAIPVDVKVKCGPTLELAAEDDICEITVNNLTGKITFDNGKA